MLKCIHFDIMMLYLYHQYVRTTLTLDDDVAAKLQSMSRRSGQSFKDVVNEMLRRGLADAAGPARRRPFRVHARDLGARRPGSFDSVADLLEQLEGPLHR
jgi:Arc/MetJ family transcription regulator